MTVARWTVAYGPEFTECKKQFRLRRARFDMHLAAIRLSLERDPYRYSTPFLSENDRVIESIDYVNDGFIMTALVKVDPSRFVCEIKWVELREVEDEDEDDDLEEEV